MAITPSMTAEQVDAIIARMEVTYKTMDAQLASCSPQIRDAFCAARVDLQILREMLMAPAPTTAPQPPAWSAAFDAWWADNRVATHKVHSAEGLARKAFHAGAASGQRGRYG